MIKWQNKTKNELYGWREREREGLFFSLDYEL